MYHCLLRIGALTLLGLGTMGDFAPPVFVVIVVVRA